MVNITGPLIRILGDRFSYNVKVAVLETLALLLAKCGAMLKPFLPQLQTTFIKALNDPNRAVRLKAAGALGQLITIHPRVDPLIQELHTGIKDADDNAIRDTMLQALRNCISGAGTKISDKVRKELVGSLEGYLSASEDATRTTAAACLGTLCACVGDDELALLLNLQLLDTDPSQDWMLRHGRSVGLGIAIKCAASRLCTSEWEGRVGAAVSAFCSADRLPISMAGMRALGFLLRHYVMDDRQPERESVMVLVKAMKQESNDLKGLAAQILTYLGKSVPRALPADTLKMVVPMLVNGTKEKNTMVRVNSEYGLVALLKLRHQGDDTYQTCLATLEPGMKDSLSDVYNKSLKRVAVQPDIHDDDIDDTILV